MENKKNLVSASEAGRILSVHTSTITTWFDDKKFPNAFAVQTGDRRLIRIPMADIEALMTGGVA
jgi:hypothetical protein